MKEKIDSINPKKGIVKFMRLLKQFPFSPDCFEFEIENVRNDSNIQYFWNNFWVGVVLDRLENEGYSIPFDFKRGLESIYRYTTEQYLKDIISIATKIIQFLDKCEKQTKSDEYHANHEYLSIREFFLVFFKCLSFNIEKNHWKNLHAELELQVLFKRFFGFYSPHIPVDRILTPEDFIIRINEILKELGYANFSILADGVFRSVGVTAEAEEKKRAYSLLTLKNYANVIECLDSIDDTKNSDIEKKENICLDRCRYALESFFKRLLLNHTINKLNDGKLTEKGTINPVAETVRTNINSIFSFPTYSKNMDIGFNKLIEASKNIISGLADDGGAHGKSNPPKVDMKTVKAAESFIILLINTILPFEK